MKGKTIFLAGMALVTAASLTSSAFAAAATVSKSDYDALIKRVNNLELKLEQKDEQRETDHTRLSTLEQSFGDVVWSFDNNRPQVRSGDGRFQLALRARFQVDLANFMQDEDSFGLGTPVAQRDLASGVVIRRAYFGIEGRAFRDFWYEFRMNFGGSNTESGDAAVNLARVAFVGIPHFRINIGVIQPIFTLSDTTSSGNLTFIERAEVVNIATDSFGGSDSRRGIELTYQNTDQLMAGDNLVLSTAFTGQKTGNNSNNHGTDEGTQWLGRAAYRFWSDGVSNAQIGGSASQVLSLTGTGAFIPPSIGHVQNFPGLTDRPEMRVDGQQLFGTNQLVSGNSIGTTGAACHLPGSLSCLAAKDGWLYGFDAGFNFRNFYMQGEYYKFGWNRDFDYYARNLTGPANAPTLSALHHAGDPEFEGWYVEGSWIITGEPKTYSASAMNNEMGSWNSPRVIEPFSWDGHSWGAWEIAGRYSEVDTNWNDGHASTTVPIGGIRGGEEKAWTVGLNWYPNNNIRFVLNYINVDADRLNAAGAFAGQKNLSIVGARMQFAF